MLNFNTIEQTIGNTPLVYCKQLNRWNNNSHNLLKLEGNNPAGSVKDRPAFSMVKQALVRGEIDQNTTLIEATSGNTGIALAMSASILKIPIILIMPENASKERSQAMQAFGAKIISVSEEEGMEGARDLALQMQNDNLGVVLNQFANDDNWRAHYYATAPEIWQQTNGRITHFVATMGTTGTITGCAKYFKERNPNIQIIGVQPKDGAQIPGIRRWPEEYIPKFFNPALVDKIIDVGQQEAESCMLALCRQEGIFAGVSSGGATHVALNISKQNADSVVVSVVCDRGDRYLSTGVYGNDK